MTRLEEALNEFDSNLTIGQVKEQLKEAKLKAQQVAIELEEIIKGKFENKFFIQENSASMFGGLTTKVYNFGKFKGSERTTEWELIYSFLGECINFELDMLYKNDIKHLTEKQLNLLEPISKEDYINYLEEYETIKNKLKVIVNGN